MTNTYNPFHHLTTLRYPDWEGDPFLRLAFIELIKQNNLKFAGPYANALESTSLAAQIALAVYDEIFPDGLNEHWDHQATTGNVTSFIIRAIFTSATTDGEADTLDRWVPDLSLADQRAIITAIQGAWTDDEKKELTKDYDGSSWPQERRDIAARPARTGMSAHFTVKPFSTSIVQIVEGGNDPIPERSKYLSRMSGPFHMTWKACQEWGFRIPKTAGFPDTNDVLINVTFNKPPKDVFLRIVSSTDDVPDPDKPGEMKSEGHTVELTKGKNRNQLALTSHDLKYHDWVFTARDDRSTE